MDYNVIVTGKLVERSYYNEASERTEKPYVLILDSTVDFPGDYVREPIKDVKELQVILHTSDNYKYINKHVKVQGELFGGISAHHFLNVLIDVKRIVILDD